MRDEILDLIRELTGQGNILAIPRVLIDFCHDVTGALMLSQILYWSDRATLAEGWFWKSKPDWEHELGISEKVLERCQRELVELGVIEIKLAGLPRVTHYRIAPEFPQLLVDFIALRKAEKAQKALQAGPISRALASTFGGALQLTEITAETTTISPADAGTLEDHEETRISQPSTGSEGMDAGVIRGSADKTGERSTRPDCTPELPGREDSRTGILHHRSQPTDIRSADGNSRDQATDARTRNGHIQTTSQSPWQPPGGVYGRRTGNEFDSDTVYTDPDSPAKPEPLTDCERWLLRISGTNGTFTDAQRRDLRKPYKWMAPDPQTKAVLTSNAPPPIQLFTEDSPRGDDFRKYVSASCDKARRGTGRVSHQNVITIVTNWRYDHAKRGPSGPQSDPSGGWTIDPDRR